MRVGRSPYVGPTTISHSTESCGAAQKGPAHSARLPCALTPARALVAVCLLGLVLFYLVMAAVQERMSRLEGATGSGMLRLGGLSAPHRDGFPGGRDGGVETAASMQLRPTRERWKGPVDLDAAVAARADEMNATWVASAEPSWWLKPGYHLSYMEEVPPYPFQRIKRVDGRDTGALAIIAPFYDLDYYRAELARAFFWRLKANGHIVVVITSYQEFPGRIDNPYDDRHTTPQDRVIHEAVDGYLHCFREPDKFLPPGVPRILLSESDFHDPDRQDGGGSLIPAGAAKQWDIFYSNQGGDWNDYARNWTLAKACFKHLALELNLKVLIMGRDLSGAADHDLSPLISSGHITAQPPSTPWRDFLRYIEASRILFAPNLHDASPRVLAEALCLDVPILVNRHILGGWKYVTNATGAFFGGEHDVVDAVRVLLSERRRAELQPRRWFKEHWGKERATFRLQAFLELAVGRERLKAAQDLAAARITYKT